MTNPLEQFNRLRQVFLEVIGSYKGNVEILKTQNVELTSTISKLTEEKLKLTTEVTNLKDKLTVALSNDAADAAVIEVAKKEKLAADEKLKVVQQEIQKAQESLKQTQFNLEKERSSTLQSQEQLSQAFTEFEKSLSTVVSDTSLSVPKTLSKESFTPVLNPPPTRPKLNL